MLHPVLPAGVDHGIAILYVEEGPVREEGDDHLAAAEREVPRADERIGIVLRLFQGEVVARAGEDKKPVAHVIILSIGSRIFESVSLQRGESDVREIERTL